MCGSLMCEYVNVRMKYICTFVFIFKTKWLQIKKQHRRG